MLRPLGGALALCVATSLAAHAEGCRYAKYATLPVDLKGTRVLLDGSINDIAQVMLVDTGSQTTWLPRKTAEQLSLKLSHSDSSTIGVGGESTVYTALVKDIKISKAHWEKVNLDVLWDTEFAYGAVIGADFLFQSDIEFSLKEKEIRFFEPDGCANNFLAYWDENAIAVPLEQAAPGDTRPTINVLINGKKLRALIDSGAPTTTIDLAAAEQLGVTPKSTGILAAGKAGGIGKHQTEAWIAPFDSFAIGEENISHPRILMHDLYGSLYKDEQKLWVGEIIYGEPPVILGEDFLRSHRVLFATSQHKLYLSYTGGPVFGHPEED